MALTATEKNQEILSLALEDRSQGYQDLVSASNALLAVLKRKGNWKTYSGATIRERLLYAKSGRNQQRRGVPRQDGSCRHFAVE